MKVAFLYLYLTEYRLLKLWLVHLETQWSQVTILDKSPFFFKFEVNITKNSALIFLILAVFEKGHLETPKGHMETK